jgi:hypothetical protein
MYVMLNREYKPIGYSSMTWVRYEDHPEIAVKLNITPTKAGKISWNGDQNTDDIYLYNDGCLPDSSSANWEAYSKRLKLLADLEKVEEPRFAMG